MKVLVIGAGGREHAICNTLKKSPRVSELYCAPGNAGISQIATCVPIPATAVSELVSYAKSETFDLVFVAPENPLSMGLVDRLEAEGIRAFGPRADAAVIESSKVFSKNLMKRYGIPTAEYGIFEDREAALRYLEAGSFPAVIKADGLAMGKGVVIAENFAQAKSAIDAMMEDAAFGDAGRTVVIEEFLTGPELTVLAFSDGKTVRPMISSRDHKRALDGDRGKNTGGMGAVSPGADLTASDEKELQDRIFDPTIQALNRENRPFVGVIYFGLMLTESGPKVIEYNSRFGDPEAQAILPRLETDMMDIIDACLSGRLAEIDICWRQVSSCCVVVASGGYPESYETGFPIRGLDKCSNLVFHAGTKWKDEQVVTSGGRVLAVYGEGDTPQEAQKKAYDGVSEISFQNMHFRRDIGKLKELRM